MATVKVCSQIHAPIDDVFRRFADIEHRASRVTGIQHIDMLTAGLVRVGTHWIETRMLIGRPESTEMEVTAFQRDRISPSARTRRASRLTPRSGSTRTTRRGHRKGLASGTMQRPSLPKAALPAGPKRRAMARVVATRWDDE